MAIVKAPGLLETARVVLNSNSGHARKSLRNIVVMTAIGLLSVFGACDGSLAQGLVVSASVTPDQVVAGSQISYTINVTNLTGVSIIAAYVTNVLSGTANNVTATNNQGTSEFFNPIVSFGSTVLFRLDNLTNNASSVLTLNLSPATPGGFTNTITGFGFTAFATNTTTVPTNLVTRVYSGQADLAVGITNSASGVLVNDRTAVGFVVTNRGTGPASDVILSNTLPLSFVPVGILPAGLTGFLTNETLYVNLGTLASGVSTQVVVFIVPTNAGDFAITAAVSAANVLDTNTLNNVVTNAMNIGTNLTADLIVTNISGQQFSPQTALMNQSLRVENVGTNDVPAFRLLVSGLGGSNRLSVTVGTNSGLPYALYNEALPTSQGVNLLLEYHVPSRTPLTNLAFSAVAVPKVNLLAPTNAGSIVTDSAFVLVGRFLGSGAFMIEFPATSNRTYTVLYSDNVAFSNALVSQPSVVSTANRKQWFDHGPPRTLRHPTNAAARFYRVIQTQ